MSGILNEDGMVYEGPTIEALTARREFLAVVWAQEFVAAAHRTSEMATDPETMLSWFAGAIMAGHARAGTDAHKSDMTLRGVQFELADLETAATELAALRGEDDLRKQAARHRIDAGRLPMLREVHRGLAVTFDRFADLARALEVERRAPTDWRCECGDLNRGHEAGCYRCGAGRPEVTDS